MTRRIVLPVLALSLLAALPALAGNKKDLTLTSPGGAIRAEIKAGGKITYAVSYGGKRILDESEIALKLGDGTVLGSDRKVKDVKKGEVGKSKMSRRARSARKGFRPSRTRRRRWTTATTG